MSILGTLGNIGKSIGSAVSNLMPGKTLEYNRPLYYNRDQFDPSKSSSPAAAPKTTLGSMPEAPVPEFVPPEYHGSVRQVASAVNATPAHIANVLKQESGLKWDANLRGVNPDDYGVSQINEKQYPLEKLAPVFQKVHGREYNPQDINDQILAMKPILDDRKNSRFIKSLEDLMVSYHLGARGVGLAKAGVEPYKSQYAYYAKQIAVPESTSTTPFGQ